jgi:SAM-dependent methyltransferase
MKKSYTKYFENHYRISYSKQDVDTYRKWFFSQWELFKKYLPSNPQISVLEIGSGIGTVYSYLLSTYKKLTYIGLELDKSAVDFCNNYYKTNSFLNVPIEKYQSTKKHNVVFAFEVLEHLADPVVIASKIHSLLAPGGVFIGTSPYPYKKNVYADDTHRYVLAPSNWSKLLKESGFAHVYTKPMSFLPFLWRINKHLNIRIPFYVPFPAFISTTLIIAYKQK